MGGDSSRYGDNRSDNVSLRESLSALMDGEVAEFEVRRILRAVPGDAGLRAAWHRYQLASQVMHGDLSRDLTDLSIRISAAIDAEPALGELRPGSWRSRLGRVAVAASVAVIAVFGVNQFQSGVTPAAPLATAPLASAVVQAQGSALYPDGSAVTAEPVASMPAPGFHFPRVGVRAVSLDSFDRPQQRVEMVGSQTLVGEVSQQQIQAYLSALIRTHAERESFGASGESLSVAPLSQYQDDPRR